MRIDLKYPLRHQLGPKRFRAGHCLSHWGHDSRPDCLLLADPRKELGTPVTVALTAATTPQIRAEITRHLDLAHPRQMIRGFNRPNVEYQVRSVDDGSKAMIIEQLVSRVEHGGVTVHAGTQREAEQVAKRLLAYGARDAVHNAFTAGSLFERIDNGQMLEIDGEWRRERLQGQIEQVQRQRWHRREQLEQIVAYAQARAGHREILLRHFGEVSRPKTPPCHTSQA